METQATEENTTQINLSFTKDVCRHCLTIKDIINKLQKITKGRTNYLHCNNCNRNYCFECFNKVTLNKNGYSYCYVCYRQKQSLIKTPKDKGICERHRCSQPATVEATIYNNKTDNTIIGNFCRKHYDHFYYYTKTRTAMKTRVSFGKKKHTRKSIIKSNLLITKNVRTKEV